MKKELGPAGKLIEKGWCRGVFATDAEGAEEHPLDDNAVCFCSMGALARAYGTGTEYLRARRKLAEYIRKSKDAPKDKERDGPSIIPAWNDNLLYPPIEVFRELGL